MMDATLEERMTPKYPAPVTKDDWAIEKDVMHPQLGRVKDVYWDSISQVWVMDLVLYKPSGVKVGRSSPAMGGPKSFEPAVPCEYWDRIEKPRFPMQLDGTGFRDWRDSAVVLPVRT